MSKLDNNGLVKGFRGNYNKQFVYKKRGEDTHLVKMPSKRKGPLTAQQEEIKSQFTLASLYAKGVTSDPALKEQYQSKVKPGVNTAFNLALRDFLKPPTVKKIDAEFYNGLPGSTLVVTAIDDFRVVSVSVRINTAAGVLVEEGQAVLNPLNLAQWIYTATQNNAVPAGTMISVTAKDLPGNKAVLEITL